jgi:hypothetical protein
MHSRVRDLFVLGILLGLIAATPAAAFEERNPFVIGLPPQPFYRADQRIIISDPDSGSVLARSPERITVNFRRFDFSLDPSSLELWIDGVEYTRSLHFWTDFAWLDLPVGFALGPGSHEIMSRITDASGAYWATTSIISIINPACPGGCPWPFAPTNEPSPVSNLMEDWQDFNGTPYFHAGLDIRAAAGTDVHSVTSGTVVNVDNYEKPLPAKWEVAVQDANGYVWQYHHLDPPTITVKKGDPVALGQVLGKVIAWGNGVNGYRYDHLHLNLCRWYGVGPIGDPYIDGWIYYNPLLHLVHGSYTDTDAPHEFDVYYADNESNSPFSADSDAGTPSLTGNIDVIAHLRDRRTVIPPANGQPYELSPYELAYSIVPISTPCGMGFLPRTKLIRFDTVPGGKLVSTQLQTLETIYKQTVNFIGVSGTFYRYDADPEYFYSITNVHNGYPDGPNGSWNTAQTVSLQPLYPDGKYQVKIYAKDIDGNETVTASTVQVANGLTYTGICPEVVQHWQWALPIHLQPVIGAENLFVPPPVPITFGPLLDGSAHATLDNTAWSPWYFDLPDRGQRIGIGLLNGHAANVEYVPLLGDVVVDADAEMQILPLGGVFDPARPVQNPVPLHLTTRLARDPGTGGAIIGHAAAYGATDFKLAMAVPLVVQGRPMTLRAGIEAGSNSRWDVAPAAVEPSPLSLGVVKIAVSAMPNPVRAAGHIRLTVDRGCNMVVNVVDLSGRRVRQVFHGELNPGVSEISWDGHDALGQRLAPGLYLLQAKSGVTEVHSKLILTE